MSLRGGRAPIHLPDGVPDFFEPFEDNIDVLTAHKHNSEIKSSFQCSTFSHPRIHQHLAFYSMFLVSRNLPTSGKRNSYAVYSESAISALVFFILKEHSEGSFSGSDQ